ncbi:MAG: M20/M25/M40 family metallo-hydrolase [Crenarchaeota archaeon]|nr:M20/M25/M40 family metallo-hydrolase [Thermoproteota archaeon]MDW8033611.1 M20/M25/M40 family metallo-hydrolase [Nitrososphaerota archaeon]
MSLNSEAVQQLVKLLSKYSPSGEEDEAQEEVFSLLISKGFENVRKDCIGNVIGEKGDGYRTLLFCSHVDTVPGIIDVKVESERVFGRGAVDAKAPLLAMILAASKYESRSLRLVFSSVVGEESDSRGIKHLLEKLSPPDYVIIGEPTGIRAAAIAYRGSANVRIRVSTKGGHSSSPMDDANAIIQLMKLVEYVKSKFTFSKDVFSNIGVSITMVKGGYGDSRIPDSSEAFLNLRYPPEVSFGKLSELFTNTLGEYCENNKNILSVQHEFLDHLDGYVSVKDKIMLNSVREAVKMVIGRDLLLIRKLGTSDFNYTGVKWGTPQIAWGPGDPSLAHSVNESISVEEFTQGIKAYEVFLKVFSSSLAMT